MNEVEIYFHFSDALDMLSSGQICEEEFNQSAIEYEKSVERDENHPLAGNAPNRAWEAQGGRLYSPYISVGKTAYVRLSIDYQKPTYDRQHLTARVHIDEQKSWNVCLVATAVDLDQIVAVWDYVAREGVKNAVEAGIITESWVSRLQSTIRCSLKLNPLETRTFAEWVEYYDLDETYVRNMIHTADTICTLDTPHPRFNDVFIIARHSDREWLNMQTRRNPRNFVQYYHDVEHRVLLDLRTAPATVREEYVRLN